MKRTDIYLTEKQHQIVKQLAADDGITFSEMFRRIIDKHLQENDKCQNAKSAKKIVNGPSAPTRAR